MNNLSTLDLNLSNNAETELKFFFFLIICRPKPIIKSKQCIKVKLKELKLSCVYYHYIQDFFVQKNTILVEAESNYTFFLLSALF